MNPNASPLQRMVDRLVAVRWAEASMVIDKKTESDPNAALAEIKWTETGRAKLKIIHDLIFEIGRASFPISPDEICWLKALAQIATMSPPPTGSGSRRF